MGQPVKTKKANRIACVCLIFQTFRNINWININFVKYSRNNYLGCNKYKISVVTRFVSSQGDREGPSAEVTFSLYVNLFICVH